MHFFGGGLLIAYLRFPAVGDNGYLQWWAATVGSNIVLWLGSSGTWQWNRIELDHHVLEPAICSDPLAPTELKNPKGAASRKEKKSFSMQLACGRRLPIVVKSHNRCDGFGAKTYQLLEQADLDWNHVHVFVSTTQDVQRYTDRYPKLQVHQAARGLANVDRKNCRCCLLTCILSISSTI